MALKGEELHTHSQVMTVLSSTFPLCFGLHVLLSVFLGRTGWKMPLTAWDKFLKYFLGLLKMFSDFFKKNLNVEKLKTKEEK